MIHTGLLPQPPLPWLFEPWQQFVKQCHDAALAHAVLVRSEADTGGGEFARAMAQFQLCDAPEDFQSCGKCRSCTLIKSDTHPDLSLVELEGSASAIKIDQIRQLNDFIHKTPMCGTRKVVVIDPADKLNINAANALLKNLEEPAGDTQLILVTSHLASVMATIRSRCAQLVVKPPSKQQSVEWLERNQVGDASTLLELAGGSPVRVMQWIENNTFEQREHVLEVMQDFWTARLSPIDVAKAFKNYDIVWLLDLLIMLTQGKQLSNAVADKPSGLEQWQTSAIKRFNVLDVLAKAKHRVASASNPNIQLLLEDLLIQMRECVSALR